MFHSVCLTSSQPCLNCTQVPIIWLNCFVCTVSPPSGSINSRLTSTQVVAHVYAGADIRVSPQFSWRFTSTQVTKIAFQLHSSPISPYPDLMMCVSTQTRPRLILIQVSRFASHLNPGPISTPSRSRDLCLLSTQAPRFTFLLCLSWILPQSGSWYLHLTYIQVTSHLHPGPPNCILVPSKHHLKPIQFQDVCLTSIHVLPRLDPGPKILS